MVIQLEHVFARAFNDRTGHEADFGSVTQDRWSVRRSLAATFGFCAAAWSFIYLIYLAI
jgi:hypothetical protein